MDKIALLADVCTDTSGSEQNTVGTTPSKLTIETSEDSLFVDEKLSETEFGSSDAQDFLSDSQSASRMNTPGKSGSRGNWTEEEDEKLRQAVAEYAGKNWKKIAERIANRSDVQCLHRWQKVLRPGLIKGPWSPEVSSNYALHFVGFISSVRIFCTMVGGSERQRSGSKVRCKKLVIYRQAAQGPAW